jgi:hypothetical protein
MAQAVPSPLALTGFLFGGDGEDVETIPTVVEDWPNCKPDVVIGLMKLLLEDRVGSNKKIFWKSYGAYASMTQSQVGNTLAFYHKLTEPIKVALLNQAKIKSAEVESTEKSRQEAVSKDDLARIIELFLHPAAVVHFSNALGTLNRRDLDARKADSTPDISGILTLTNIREYANVFDIKALAIWPKLPKHGRVLPTSSMITKDLILRID